MVADSPNLTCYIDGKSEGSQTIQTIPETMKLDNLSLGAGNKNLRDNSKIVVDDLRVYNYAFNSIQAWNLYESYPPIDIYDFCRLSQTKKANPEITEEECKALIDLYVNTD